MCTWIVLRNIAAILTETDVSVPTQQTGACAGLQLSLTDKFLFAL